jgi:hypothetical protein
MKILQFQNIKKEINLYVMAYASVASVSVNIWFPSIIEQPSAWVD